jgi:multidrug efflux pump subunit AcrA (membrane-fusion protein)
MRLHFKRTLRRGLWILPVLVLGFLAVMPGRWFGTKAAQAPASSSSTSTPQGATAKGSTAPAVYTVANSDISRTILLTGELQSAQSTDIMVPTTKASATSTITFMADEGKTLKKGDRLVEYDTSALVTQMDEQQRQVDNAALSIEKTRRDQEATRCDKLNAVAQAQGNLKIAKINADIPKEIEPSNDYLNYQNQYAEAKLSLQKAQEDLANFEAAYDAQIGLAQVKKSQLEVTLKRMQNDLVLLTVDAPQDGVVIYGDNWASNRKFAVGDIAMPGQVVITLPDLTHMQVSGYVYDTEVQYMMAGMPCNVSLDAVPAKSWHGTVTSLSGVALKKGFSTTQMVFKAIILLDSVDLNYMKPGMTARAEFVLSMVADVPAVPRVDLALDKQGQYYVLKDMGPKTPPEKVAVKVGAFGDKMVQILSGVNVGDRLLPVQRTTGD